MQIFDIEKKQDNRKLLKEYADRIRKLGDRESSAEKNNSGEE